MDEQQAYQKLKNKLSDRYWRLNNLYWITDKAGARVKFHMNWAQVSLYENMHYQNLILKARQLGMTTAICIFMLDTCLFNSNIRAGIVAHNREDAESFFQDKIKYPYDNLPEAIRNERTAPTDSKRELKFSNNSSIKVGTAMRSGTLQYLHISEFGKICAKYPDKAKEIVTGSLNTVQAGQVVFIESTAEGREGYFYDFCQQAQNIKKSDKELSELDFKFFFFPWHHHPEYQINSEDVVITQELIDYFESLQNNYGIILSDEQKAWYSKKYITQQDEMKREYPSTPAEAFEAALIGSYYGSQMDQARTEKRITNVPYDPSALVHTAWDLGVGDSMSIWFFQMIGQEIHFIDYYENAGEGLPHYKQLLLSKKYNYGNYFAPHDIAARELTHGLTRKEKALQLGINFVQLPRLGVDDGIQAARSLFHRCWFDESKCARGILCLENYRKKWNDKLGCFSTTPLHDWASHGADSFRYAAIAISGDMTLTEDNWESFSTYRDEMLSFKDINGI